eukprot:gene6084-biopygen8443
MDDRVMCMSVDIQEAMRCTQEDYRAEPCNCIGADPEFSGKRGTQTPDDYFFVSQPVRLPGGLLQLQGGHRHALVSTPLKVALY